jgi:exodeoxyribonuclease V alpha subunit
MLLQRNLLYTGVTRGKRLVVLVGQGKALAMAVKNNRTQRRFSGLAQRLKGDESVDSSLKTGQI